jgi:hypothetical protein
VGLLFGEVLDAPENGVWRIGLESAIGRDEEKGLGLEDLGERLWEGEDGGK